MRHNTRDTLTVLFTGLLCSSAGFWLMPGQVKGAIVGGVAGTAAAAGYVHQDRRFKQLAHKQKELTKYAQVIRSSPQERKISDDFGKKTIQKLQEFESFMAEHKIKISELESALRPKPGQAGLTRNEVNHIRNRLKSLESKLATDTPDASDGDSDALERFEARLKALESKASYTPDSTFRDEYEAVRIQGGQDEQESEDEVSGGEDAQHVIEWFNNREIEVENYYEPDPKIDNLLDGLSIYLGDNYSTLNKFHRQLRNSVGKRFHFNLNNYESREKRIHNQFLQRLKSSDYLSIGRMVKNKDASDFIIAAPHKRSDIQGFFDGGWFERFVYYKVIELFDSEGANYQYLRNSKIVYQDGESSELDLFFLVNGKPILIECKAGLNYDSGIEKFVSHRERLGIDPSSAIFVVFDIGDSEAYIRSKNWNITVTDTTNFLTHIKDIIAVEGSSQSLNKALDDTDEDLEDESGEAASLLVQDDTLEGFFKRKGLNQAPEYRALVFEELIELIEHTEEPVSFTDLTKKIRDRVKSEHSLGRRKIQEILNCLRHSDIFRNSQNKPEKNASKPISYMASKRIKILEKKCMDFYAEKVLQLYDPDFFEEEKNTQEFERLTLGKAPQPKKIQQPKEK